MAGRSRTRAYHGKSAGAVNVSEAQIEFSAAAARVLIESLPLGALIWSLSSFVEVVTAFNAGTSNLLTVGWGAIGAGTADDIIATVTEGTPGMYPGVAGPVRLAAAQDIYVYYTPGAADATTGLAYAYLMWSRLADNGEL